MNEITTVVCRSLYSLIKALNDVGITIIDDQPDEPDPRHGTDPEPGTVWGESGVLTLGYQKNTTGLTCKYRYFFDSYPNYMTFSYINIVNDGIVFFLEQNGGTRVSSLGLTFGYIGPSGDTDWVLFQSATVSSEYVAVRNNISIKIDEEQGFLNFNPNFIPMPTPNSIHLVEYYVPENHIILDNVFACKQVPAYALTNRVFSNQHTSQYHSIPDYSETGIPVEIYNGSHNQHWADTTQYSPTYFGERVKIDEQVYCIVPSYMQRYEGTTNENYSNKSKYTNYACFAYRLS